MGIEDAVEDLACEAAFWMEGLTDPACPLEQMGETTLEVCEKLRALGIAILLSRGDSDAFFHNLIRSGRTRLAFLERAGRERHLDDHNAGTGQMGPLLDAIAAADLDLARRIGRASRPEFLRESEYEDDYCFGRVVAALAEDSPDAVDLEATMKRFLAYLEKRPNGRWSTCDALIRRDGASFAVGFASLLDERDVEVGEDVERGQIENAVVMTQRFVFVEGLALLRLAERRGLPTLPDYRMCPALARVPMKKPFPGY